MPDTKGAKVNPLQPSFVQRAAQALRYAFTGTVPAGPNGPFAGNADAKSPIVGVAHPVQSQIDGVGPDNFFGPLNPIGPVAQDQVWSRRFDYPTGYNTRYVPRSEEPMSFETLRMLADTWDVLRLVIETRKDQLDQLDWDIRYKDQSKKADKDCGNIKDFFEYPDKLNNWSEWLRMVVEDLFVIDAPCILPRFNKGKGLYALEVMDGAMIKPLLDVNGRIPLPPSPAFQQIVKGLPMVDYTLDELIYKPRNKRSWKVYGYSPVEQIVLSTNIGIRRSVSNLQYYTEGSLPDSIISLPDTWNAEQIRLFQEYWDELLAGNTAERRKTRFMPGAGHYIETREPGLKDDFDEWLARIVCYAFSVEPTPFVKQQNRATAQTAREQSIAEGQAALKKWIKLMMDMIIIKYFKRTDIEFIWQENNAIDPMQQAQIDQIYLGTGVVVPNEVRENLGFDPLPEPVENDPAQPQAMPPDNVPPSPPKPAVGKSHVAVLDAMRDREGITDGLKKKVA